MGFFSSIGRAFGIGAGDPAAEARNALQAASGQARGTIEEEFGRVSGTLDPFVTAGAEALPGVVQGTTAGGLDERLREIFGGESFRALTGERERAVRGQLAAGGLTRSGTAVQELANVPTELGFQIENLLAGRQTGLAGQGFGAATTLGQFGAGSAANVANIQRGVGQSEAAGIISGAEAESAGATNVLRGLSGGLSFFSDRRLKTNIVKVRDIGELGWYRWDWIPGTEDTIVSSCDNEGFMSDEVKQHFPDHVYEFGGFDVLDYSSIVKELEVANGGI